MKLTSYLAAAALSLLPLCSQAGVIYQWQATNDETPYGITLEMEFDEQTVAGGVLNYAFEQGWDEPPAQGLLNLRYTFPYMAEETVWSARNGGFSSELGRLDLQLGFGSDGYLSGYIYLNDGYSHIELLSNGRRFTVVDANSDEEMVGAGCPWVSDYDCSGATGVILRDGAEPNEPGEVPEPGTLALLGAGLLAAARLRRTARA